MERLSDVEVIPLVEERAYVEKRVVETSDATLAITTHEQSQTLTGDVLSASYVIERRPVGRFVDAPPEVRMEGESTVYPIVEEVLVKRLMLREEIRVTPTRTRTPFSETVALRQQRATLERRDLSDPSPDRPSKQKVE
jgi:stress response protein YsnF